MDDFNIVDELKSRIADPFEKRVDCGEGWFGLLSDLHDKLAHIDPNYVLFEVKEKFGALRFYYEASNPEADIIFRSLVRMYERMSERICEVTGEPGILMKRDGVYKTLNERFESEGWEQAFQPYSGIDSNGVNSEQ